MIDKIKSVLIFSQLPDILLESLIKKGYISIRKIEKGNVILHQDNEYNMLYGIVSGICNSEMIDISGKSMKIDDFYQGELIAPGIIFSCDNRLPVSVVTKSDCELVIIDKKGVLELCMNSEIFLLDFMKLVSDKVTFLTKKLLFISFKSIKSKFAGFLLSKIKDESDTVVISKSIEELSDYFGVARPSLSRVISDMENEGLITHNRNVYKILDKEALYKSV